MEEKSATEIRREKLRRRSKQAVETREQKGLGKKSALDWSKFAGERPPEFSPKSGKDKNLIDIVPFKITQPWYKDLRTHSGQTTNLDVGDWDYKLELPVHRRIGENNDTFLCRRLAFGYKCPICEEMFTEYEKDKPSDKKLRGLFPSWRDWYNIYNYDEGANPDGVLQVWEDAAYKLFEEQVLAEAREEGEEVILYSDIKEGKSIEFKGKEKRIGEGRPFIEAQSIEFKDRDPYEEKIIDDTVSFDALVRIPTYEDVACAHLGIDEGNEPPAEEPSSEETPDEKSSAPASSGRRRRQTTKPESEETPQTDEDNPCPEGRIFGYNCDPAAEECKRCSEETFNACANLLDKIEKKQKADQEKADPPPRRRRRGAGGKK